VIDEIVRLLLKQIRIAEVDALVVLLFAVIGYLSDTLFFPGGITTVAATVLTAT
jgi:hypothetical protein